MYDPSLSFPHLRINQILLLPILALLLVLFTIVPRILALPRVVLVQHLLRDPVQQLLGVDPEQLPRLIERLVDASLLVRALGHERLLELLEELERQLVFVGQRFLSDDGLHGCCVTADGVFGVQLVGHIRVIATGAALADGGLHETGQGGEDVDWWVDTLVVKLTVDEDLALGNVTSKIGDGVGDIW